MKSRYGCKEDGCEKHPSKGDFIIRTSPKGEPFEGYCEDHYPTNACNTGGASDGLGTPKG